TWRPAAAASVLPSGLKARACTGDPGSAGRRATSLPVLASHRRIAPSLPPEATRLPAPAPPTPRTPPAAPLRPCPLLPPLPPPPPAPHPAGHPPLAVGADRPAAALALVALQRRLLLLALRLVQPE